MLWFIIIGLYLLLFSLMRMVKQTDQMFPEDESENSSQQRTPASSILSAALPKKSLRHSAWAAEEELEVLLPRATLKN
jgi:hypothetical protein